MDSLITKNNNSVSQKRQSLGRFSVRVEDIEEELPEGKINDLNKNDLAVNVIISAELPNKILAQSAKNPFLCPDYWHEKGYNMLAGDEK